MLPSTPPKLRKISLSIPKLSNTSPNTCIVNEIIPSDKKKALEKGAGTLSSGIVPPVYGATSQNAETGVSPDSHAEEAASPQKGVEKPKVVADVIIPDGKVVHTSRIKKNVLKLIKLNKYSKIYIINCFFLLVSMLCGVFVNILFNTLEDVPSYSSFVSSGNIMIAGFIILFFALDAVFRENEFQMVLFIVVCCAITLVMIGNSILKTVELIRLFVQHQEWIRALQFVLNSTFSILVILSLTIFIGLAYPVYKSFGWKLFKVVGTNKTLLRAFKIYNIWITILKADMVLTIDLSLLNLFFAPSESWGWFFAVFFTLLFHLIGYLIVLPVFRFAARHEIRLLFVAALCYQLLFPIWLAGKTLQTIIFLFITGEAYQNPWRHLPVGMANWSIDILFSYGYMGGLSVVGLIFRGMVLFFSILVLIHMKKGLREIFVQRELYGKAKRKKRREIIIGKRKERKRHKKKKKRDKIKQDMATKMASQIGVRGDFSGVLGISTSASDRDGRNTGINASMAARARAATVVMATTKDGATVPVVVDADVDLSETDDDLSKSDRFSSSDSSESEENYEDEVLALEIQQEQERRQQHRRNII
mmetsp:Transcript_9510/g.35278  ORF Transcript_9510/g.35278 Transcript_9510/m.35278 type:complete len:590 (-) Transcript_9510:83-1852(-)|eukprot:CAMPEP_0117442392 /NCGR_PEP_ID=MMETSP0759-20121206/4126_1 /TAXON_ID=63605 /ORGANISM="Percolomonas cosmopolitus, Strain WS" /LENGTH=589 /DNA_ID=CAMNT_0005234275 /DNA_START=478 /DNA_END=2247 /DNA_ORIENTATION=-